MTHYKPFLKINRLIVYSLKGQVAYDEKFKSGVNIIRGQNGSGKSTISNFIFYILGGDFNKWTSAALECSNIIAEIECNDSKITLKRDVNGKAHQPMFIFWDNIEKALDSSSENWQVYPYRITDNKISFSKTLFNALGMPELKGDVDSNISMHQILRLMYIDQKSLTDSLMLTEMFDSPLTRQTIAELLLGVYDDSLYTNKLNLRENKKDFEINRSQLQGVLEIFKSTGNEINLEEIKSQIDNNILQLEKTDQYLINLEEKKLDLEAPEIKIEAKPIEHELLTEKHKLNNIKEQISEFELEIADSIQFIISLEKRVNSLNDSLAIRNGLESLQITHCPSCLSLIMAGKEHDNCYLCKQPLSEDEEKSQVKRMQQELLNQIRESKNLLKQKELILLELRTSFPAIQSKVKILQVQLDGLLKTTTSSVSKELQLLFINKGRLLNENEFLLKQLKAVERLEVLKKELIRLKLAIERLDTAIKEQEANQQYRYNTALGKIKEIAKFILQNDLPRQAEFRVANEVQIDFEKNTYGLDGKNNFSESSNILLKNSIRFGIFFASLRLEFFRYPRFILCDNMEDKGMEEARSQNFQKLICQISDSIEVDHQIIFTTSAIAPELNNDDRCVGKFYNENEQTLKLN